MRGKGEGSVSRSSDGSGWVARIELPRTGGKRQRRKRRAKTRAEAIRLLREMQDELAATGALASVQRTVGEAVDEYRSIRAGQRLSEGALEDVEWAARIIKDRFASSRLVELSVLDCDQFLAACATGTDGRQPMSRGRLGRIRRCLIRVLANEMRTGRLSRNVAELSVLPGSSADESNRRALSADELGRLLDAATGSRLIIIDFCGRNALRPAEARSVRWCDIDLDCYELSVRGQQDRQNNRGDVKKATNAARTISLDQTTVDRLKDWREHQLVLESKAGPAWHNLDVVASTAAGTAIDRHSLARSIRLLCKKVGIEPPIAPYELRHTAISRQADAGHSAWEIADWAGTSEAMISRTYRHRLRRVATLKPVEDEIVRRSGVSEHSI